MSEHSLRAPATPGRARLLLAATAAAALAVAACRDAPPTPGATEPAAAAAPRAQLVGDPEPVASVTVQVPASMRTPPFDAARTLRVPDGFDARVYARVPGARFMAFAPNGDLLVSNPGAGRVMLVRRRSGGDPTVTPWATGLYRPHDIVFHTIGAQWWVYVAEADKIARYAYTSGDSIGRGRQVVIAGLPSASLPELRGSYGHELKNIALDANGNLYVSIASVSNASPSDAEATPVRGSVYVYPAAGGAGRLFARGLRNAEGLAMVPGTNVLWVVVNNRDNIAYPFQNDFDGNGTNDYGKVLSRYVDNHPPEEFTRVVDGGDYGWPFCNPNPDAGLDDMPFDRDVQTNADGARLDCARATRVSKGIQAHSAPLGLTFFQGTNVPAPYGDGAAIAYHGSWNRTTRTGYKVVFFPWNATTGRPGTQVDLVTGWTAGGVWGRPVDVAADAAGAIYVSDDESGTIYRFARTAAAQRVATFTLFDATTDRPIAGYDPLPNGATLDLAALPSRALNVRANTDPTRVGSVRFGLDANASFRVESVFPYVLAGDRTSGGVTDYLPWTPTVGTHTLTATPFTGSGATGTAGTPLQVTFTVVDRAAASR